eukprot:1945006-Prymnesium_polylepis.1
MKRVATSSEMVGPFAACFSSQPSDADSASAAAPREAKRPKAANKATGAAAKVAAPGAVLAAPAPAPAPAPTPAPELPKPEIPPAATAAEVKATLWINQVPFSATSLDIATHFSSAIGKEPRALLPSVRCVTKDGNFGGTCFIDVHDWRALEQGLELHQVRVRVPPPQAARRRPASLTFVAFPKH